MYRKIRCFLTIYKDDNAVIFILVVKSVLKSPEDSRNADFLKHLKACCDFTVSEFEWFEENFYLRIL